MTKTTIDEQMAINIVEFIYDIIAEHDEEGAGLPYNMDQEQYEKIKEELRSEFEVIARSVRNKVMNMGLRLRGRDITIEADKF